VVVAALTKGKAAAPSPTPCLEQAGHGQPTLDPTILHHRPAQMLTTTAKQGSPLRQEAA
jgi:hypothetical protein